MKPALHLGAKFIRWGLGLFLFGLFIGFGILYWVLAKDEPAAHVGSAGLWLCIIGLIGVFCTGYVGYFVADAIWPQFYYQPIEAGKNAWLLAQFICMISYFVGAILVCRTVGGMLREAMQNNTADKEKIRKHFGEVR